MMSDGVKKLLLAAAALIEKWAPDCYQEASSDDWENGWHTPEEIAEAKAIVAGLRGRSGGAFSTRQPENFPCTCAPAHRKLVRHLLSHPDVLSLSVWDGDDEEAFAIGKDGVLIKVKECRDEAVIIDALEGVDLSELIVHRRIPELASESGKMDEWVQVIPFQVDRHETVADYTSPPISKNQPGIVDAWFESGQR